MSLVRESYRQSVVLWLISIAVMILVMVAIGGITRLTHSGLSMASWHPLTGFIPPRSEADWRVFFDLYKQTPEYIKVNHGINLAEFKAIFWWEFIHRLWGRLIGMWVLLPFLYFIWRRALSGRMSLRIIWLLLLGGLQGVIGWIMVKSGMVDAPYVHPVKLGLHLLTALIIYAYVIWYIHDLLNRPMSYRPERVHGRFVALTLLLLTMIFTGALVAALKAGFIYNTWPRMGGDWVPAGLGAGGPWLVDISSNPTTAQFVHRWLAIIVLASVIAIWWSVRDYVIQGKWRWIMPAIMVVVQVGLGIATLLLSVPVWLGVGHQLGAVILLTFVLSQWHGLTQRPLDVR